MPGEQATEDTALLGGGTMLTRRAAFEGVLKLAVPTTLSYTFSMLLVVIGVMMGRLGHRVEEEGDEGAVTRYLAATALIVQVMQFLVASELAPAFATGILGSQAYGELRGALDSLFDALARQSRATGQERSASDLRRLCAHQVQTILASPSEEGWAGDALRRVAADLSELPDVLPEDELLRRVDALRQGLPWGTQHEEIALPVLAKALRQSIVVFSGEPLRVQVFAPDGRMTEGSDISSVPAGALRLFQSEEGIFVPLEADQEVTPEALQARVEEVRDGIRLQARALARMPRNNVIIGWPPLLLPLALVPFARTLFEELGQPDDAAFVAATFLGYYAPGFVGVWTRMFSEQTWLALGRPDAVMKVALATFGTATAVVSLFCFGPSQMDYRALAAVFGVEALVTSGLFAGGLHLKFPELRFFRKETWRGDTPADRAQRWALFDMGWPILVNLAMQMGTGLVMSLMYGAQGKEELAAQNFAGLFGFFSLIWYFAVGQATAQEFGRRLGGEDFAAARRVAEMGMWVGFSLMGPLGVLILARPELLNAALTSGSTDSEVMKMLPWFLTPAVLVAWSDTADLPMINVLRGVGDTQWPTWLSIGGMWAGVAAAAIASAAGGDYRWMTTLFAAGHLTGTALVARRWQARTTVPALREWHRVQQGGVPEVRESQPSVWGKVGASLWAAGARVGQWCSSNNPSATVEPVAAPGSP